MSDLSSNEVRGLARAIALAAIGRGRFIGVRSAGTTDLGGNRALDITFALSSEEVAITVPAMETHVGVRNETTTGSRFIDYVTPRTR